MQSIGAGRTGVPCTLPRLGGHVHPCLTAATPKAAGRLLKSQRATLIKAQAASTDKKEGYDVYVYEPERLEEGVRKHTLSVFVADESGLINRVAGVFARRGANIESLAVGLTQDKALFTIVATGTDPTVANLCKQLAKLVNVRYVEDITDAKNNQRELMLIKVRAPPGGTERGEINDLVRIFRGRIVDVGEATFTISVTGDPGKMVSFQKALNKFGIVQLARTGSIAVKRGEQLFNETESRWKAGVAGAAPTPRKQSSSSSSSRNGNDSGSDSESSYGVYAPEASVDYEEGWGADVLDAAYTPSGHKVKSSTLSIDVQDVPGVLNQVTGVISRRGYNIQSLAVGNAETEGMSRICLVVPGDEKEMSNLVKQLLKLVYVSTVTLLTKVPHVARELMMVKIACPPEKRGEVMDVATIFHGNVCDLSKTTLTMEVVGKEDKMRALQEVLEPYGILEIARTGRVALERESGVDTAYLENVAGNKVHL